MVREIAVDDLRFSYGSIPVLRGISVAGLMSGEITAVIGPNAAGKSTFFKCLAGLIRGEGRILLDGRDSARMKHAEISRRVTYLPQENTVSAVLTVFESVLLARQQSASWRVTDDDLTAVQATLVSLEIGDLGTRHLNELSGGQRQMVSIAQALVRNPDVLILDEPTNNLDLQRQMEVLELLRAATVARGLTTIVALHDLNLAARYADRIVVLSEGTVYASGDARSILTPTLLRDIYGVHATVAIDEEGCPIVIPRASVRQRTVTTNGRARTCVDATAGQLNQSMSEEVTR